MKNMKKLVALFAATVMTMSFGVSAFAATVDTTVEGQGDASESFNLVFTAPDGGEADIDQLTMIAYLVAADTDPEEIPDYSSQTVVAINQVGGDVGFGLVPVDVKKLEEGYAIAVAMGGTDVSDVVKFLITYDKATETITIVIGDVDGSGTITSNDADYISAYVAAANKATYNTENNKEIGITIATNVILGDVDGSGTITSNDADYISAYVAAANKATYNTENNKEIGVTKSYNK